MLTEFSLPKKKSSLWKWVVVILLLAGLGFGAYLFVTKFMGKVRAKGCPINPRDYINSLKSQSSDDTL